MTRLAATPGPGAPARARPWQVHAGATHDGVWFWTDRAWAVARRGGRVRTGDTRHWRRAARLPAVRDLAIPLLCRAMAPTVPGIVRLRVVVVTLMWVALHVHLPLLVPGALPRTLALLAAGTGWIAAVHALLPRSLWRFHSAEHRVLHRYSRRAGGQDTRAGAPVGDTSSLCHANWAWLPVAAVVLAPATPLAALAVALVAILAAEATAVASRRPDGIVGRALLLPGALVQRRLLLVEPGEDEVRLAATALAACLRRHHAAGGPPLTTTARR